MTLKWLKHGSDIRWLWDDWDDCEMTVKWLWDDCEMTVRWLWDDFGLTVGLPDYKRMLKVEQ